MKKIIFLLPIFIAILIPQPVHAQVKYEDVVEKIHYAHPNRFINEKPYDAVKQVGSKNPLINVYIWADLTDTYTQRFFKESFDTLKSKYGDKALFIYNHRTLFNTEKSIRAAIISECTAQQNNFWENITPIIDNSESLTSLNKLDYLKNINKEQLQTCIDNPNTKSTVEISDQDGQYFGFNSVPLFIIQNASKPQEFSIKIIGAQDQEIWDKSFLEAEQGDLTNKKVEDLSNKVNVLEQKLEQSQQALNETQKKVSLLEGIVNNLQNTIKSITEKIQSLFHFKK